jgi:hypothetical protein
MTSGTHSHANFLLAAYTELGGVPAGSRGATGNIHETSSPEFAPALPAPSAGRLRAIEEELPLIRAAKSGVSGAIDPWVGSSHGLAPGIEGVPDSSLPATIAPTTFTRVSNIPVARRRRHRTDFRAAAAHGKSGFVRKRI